MNVKRLVFRIAIGILFSVLVFLTASVWLTYRASGRTEAPLAQVPAPAIQAPAKDRAFVTIENAPASTDRGAAWTVTLTSNAWSKCLVDLYMPSEEPLIFPDPALAEAEQTASGSFTWTWNVPSNAKPGTWTARVLCGSTDDLASRDVKIEVR
jgi:hypothetical protein